MIDATVTDDALDYFTTHRRLLFATAYRMLGSVADAEDVLQDAWLKWSRTEHGSVANARADTRTTGTTLTEVPHGSHFDVIDPDSTAWPYVTQVLGALAETRG